MDSPLASGEAEIQNAGSAGQGGESDLGNKGGLFALHLPVPGLLFQKTGSVQHPRGRHCQAGDLAC